MISQRVCFNVGHSSERELHELTRIDFAKIREIRVNPKPETWCELRE